MQLTIHAASRSQALRARPPTHPSGSRQLQCLIAILLLLLVVLISGCRAHSLPDGHYKLVVRTGHIDIHKLDAHHTLVRTVDLPFLKNPRGVAANATTDALYIPYYGNRHEINQWRQFFGFRPRGRGYVARLELSTGKVVWKNAYHPSIDSLAVTPDGSTLYMPSGEELPGASFWFVIDTDKGDLLKTVPFAPGAHNTIVSEDGIHVYMASLGHDHVGVYDTREQTIVRTVGPFGERVRPIALSRDESFLFANVNFLSGFEVADLLTSKVIHRVQVEGYPWTDPELPATQSHGLSLTPDEREVWVVDAFNKRVHVFDATGLPDSAPRQVASVDVNHPDYLPKWINSSRDGRFMHVSTGAIIDTQSRKVITTVAQSRYFIEFEIRGGKTVKTYSRYGNGYADHSLRSNDDAIL